MTRQTVTLELPELLYQKLRLRAAQSQRTIEHELLEVLATAVPVADDLPTDLSGTITSLATLNDADLWRAAQTLLPANATARLEELHVKRQCEGLTEYQEREAAALIHQYERVMLIRAQATALLKQGGHDVARLLAAA